MTENQLDALVNDGIFNLRSALFQLEQHMALEHAALDRLEADRNAELSASRLPAGVVVALRAVAELRLLVQLRRQAGRFVDDNLEHDGSDF